MVLCEITLLIRSKDHTIATNKESREKKKAHLKKGKRDRIPNNSEYAVWVLTGRPQWVKRECGSYLRTQGNHVTSQCYRRGHSLLGLLMCLPIGASQSKPPFAHSSRIPHYCDSCSILPCRRTVLGRWSSHPGNPLISKMIIIIFQRAMITPVHFETPFLHHSDCYSDTCILSLSCLL